MLGVASGSQNNYIPIIIKPGSPRISRGRRSVVTELRPTFHRATTLRIGHRKLQRGLHVQSKTIFDIVYHISRILSDILRSKTFWRP